MRKKWLLSQWLCHVNESWLADSYIPGGFIKSRADRWTHTDSAGLSGGGTERQALTVRLNSERHTVPAKDKLLSARVPKVCVCVCVCVCVLQTHVYAIRDVC